MKKSEYGAAKMLAECIHTLQQNNVSIKLSKSKRVKSPDGSLCKGYWEDSDSNNLVFACSIQGDIEEWIGTFAHEYCHFLQWLDKDKVWCKYHKLDPEILINCITNKPIKEKDLDYYLTVSQDIELDCEKRTVKLLKSYGVPIDYEKYIRSANVYIFYYSYLKISRRWNNTSNISIYKIPTLQSIVKSKFYSSYGEIPDNLLKAFIRYEPPVKRSKIII
jgi:hypothetical protein